MFNSIREKLSEFALSSRENKLVAELRSDIREIAESNRKGEEVDPAWADYESRLQSRIRHQNPCRFLAWPEIRNTMHLGRNDWGAMQMSRLNSNEETDTNWLKVAEENCFGGPIICEDLPSTGWNSLHMTHHLFTFKSLTGHHPKDFKCVIEIGGGYGCMAKTLRNAGFVGSHLIYDLPLFSAIQRFYLRGIGLTSKQLNLDEWPSSPETLTTSTLSDLQRISIPQPCLFIATWSLSESPLALRARVEGIASRCNALLIGYQDRFRKLDNVEYFSSLQRRLPQDFQWLKSSTGLPDKNHYLFATRPGTNDSQG